jgi:hypothetical protein
VDQTGYQDHHAAHTNSAVTTIKLASLPARFLQKAKLNLHQVDTKVIQSCVFRAVKECLPLQVLFDSNEKQFDYPALYV